MMLLNRSRRRTPGGVFFYLLSGSLAEVRRSDGRIRHRYNAGAKAHQLRQKYERTPPSRLGTDVGQKEWCRIFRLQTTGHWAQGADQTMATEATPFGLGDIRHGRDGGDE